MDIIQEKIRKSTGIIVFSGAGVSTSCGIPDYRSPTGVYNTISFGRSSQGTPEYEALLDTMRKATPSPAHKFCVDLEKMGKLIRVYTQNIDELYQKAGLPLEKLVEVHGSISKGVIHYGEDISQDVKDMIRQDLINNVHLVDLIIVMGTSLVTMPFAALPNMVRKNCWRIFINRDLTVLPPVRRRKERDGVCSGTMSSNISICGRKVTTKPTWMDSKFIKPGLYLTKWKHQYLFDLDCDQWVDEVMVPE